MRSLRTHKSAWITAFLLAAASAAPSALSGCSSEDSTLEQQVNQLPQGQFLLGVSLEAIGGLVLPYRLDIVEKRVELRAISNMGVVSEVLASATDIEPAEDGSFSIDFGTFTQPGAYVPTGSDVDVTMSLSGQVRSAEFLCGELEGTIVTLNLPLAGSTFGAIPFAEGARAPTSCAGAPEDIPRIEDCPVITPGVTTDFPSGNEPREFELVLPSSYDAASTYPLVFVYHGFGGTPQGMLEGVGFRARADLDNVILVAPRGLETGNGAAWNISTAPAQNVDVALFDDLRKCVSESFSVDAERVYVTGMSNGGLMTGTLLATRSSVIAAAAPFSGGISLPYEKSDNQPPALVVYGGPTDIAFEQDFTRLANEMAASLKAEGHFTVLCNHNEGHNIEASYLTWAMRFLLDHTLGGAPAYTELPSEFPDYCAIQ